MGSWQTEPSDAWDGLKEYLDANVPGYSVACDANRRLINLDVPSMSDLDVANLVAALRLQFPGAFPN